MPRTALLLDLDGTLTDPREGITRCIQHALRALGRAVPDQSELLRYIGPPLQQSFLEMLNGDREEAARALTLYRERFSEVGLYENHPYPGIDDALARLRERGITLFLATSKPAVYAERIVEHFGLGQHLEAVFGSELDGRRTDKSELLEHVLRLTEVEASQAAMVGDRRHDMVGARANMLRAIGVTWGFGTSEELLSAGASELIHAPEMLGDIDLEAPPN